MPTVSIKATLAALVAASLTASSGAQAAAAAAASPVAAAPAAAMTGPLVAGVCLLSQQTLVSRSKIGLAAVARLQELTRASQVEFDGEKRSIEARAKALGAKRGTLPPAQLQAQGQALNQRFQALQGEAQARSRQLDATRAKVDERIVETAAPFIAPVFAVHACGLLLAREAVLGGNMTNDLTADVVAAMDAKATPLAFGLEPAAR